MTTSTIQINGELVAAEVGEVLIAAPGRWHNMVRVVAELDDSTMRVMGLFCMILGLGILYLVN